MWANNTHTHNKRDEMEQSLQQQPYHSRLQHEFNIKTHVDEQPQPEGVLLVLSIPRMTT